jgi:hypothetical protein
LEPEIIPPLHPPSRIKVVLGQKTKSTTYAYEQHNQSAQTERLPQSKIINRQSSITNNR